MNDNIDKNEIRRAIDRLQVEHPCGIAYDPTTFVNMEAVNTIKECVDKIARRMMEDTEINIICEFAKLYLDGVKPTIESKRSCGEWISCSEKLPSYSERIVLATVVRRDKTWNNDPYHRLVTYSNGKWYPVPQSINLVPSHMATIEQSDGGQAEVIAWMPLPDAYREETMRNDRERS